MSIGKALHGAVAEVHKDSDHLSTGTHKGSSGTLTLSDPNKDFKSCGVAVGLAIYNDTDGSNGLVTAVTEDDVTCTLSGGSANTWTVGDTYKIYKTAAYNTTISTQYTDKRFGRKVTGKDRIEGGLFPEDVDLDEYEKNVFGPGQPE